MQAGPSAPLKVPKLGHEKLVRSSGGRIENDSITIDYAEGERAVQPGGLTTPNDHLSVKKTLY
eukprot:908794-Pelagomonas_calceolata.AAC.1